MKIIVGLGNPLEKYAYTRHNVGFLCIDFLQKSLGTEDWQDSRFHALVAKGHNILLVKPTTYMNLSGDAVQAIAHFYKIEPQDILVISDDIDMEFAKVRMREAGSHGGQNGLRHIIEKIGTHEFARIKIGIGRDDRYEVADWVLSRFTQIEREALEGEVFAVVEERVRKWIE